MNTHMRGGIHCSGSALQHTVLHSDICQEQQGTVSRSESGIIRSSRERGRHGADASEEAVAVSYRPTMSALNGSWVERQMSWQYLSSFSCYINDIHSDPDPMLWGHISVV